MGYNEQYCHSCECYVACPLLPEIRTGIDQTIFILVYVCVGFSNKTTGLIG
jgi:hypothetical protein